MKKLLSLILVAIMLVTAMPVAFAEGNTYKVGDIVQFGSYPQSEVTDSATVAALNAKAPAWDDWTSYGYYSGDDDPGTMVQGDWMRYTDIVYNDNKYRGVRFIQYRPSTTYYKVTDETATKQYQNGYFKNITYWFRFDSINWRILDPNAGLIVSETIVDAQPYSNKLYYNVDIDNAVSILYSKFAFFNNSDYSVYASDYETSSIRKWLNSDFYNTAFNDLDKKKICDSILNNASYYSLIGESGYTALDSKETNDKIFLLSYDDVKNDDYGFSSEVSDLKKRTTNGTDYAKCQGLFEDAATINGEFSKRSAWILRSPGYHSLTSCVVSDLGYTESFAVVADKHGTRPALRVDDISSLKLAHIHKYNPTTTEPTCKDKGFTTYICECGDSYVDNYVDTVNHKDDNKDYKCDYGCGYEFEKPAPEGSDEPKAELNFFQKIIQWFKDLFDKLFGWLK